VFENRVLRKMFRPKREDVAGECIMVHGTSKVPCVRLRGTRFERECDPLLIEP
jgi:hypothetical protein